MGAPSPDLEVFEPRARRWVRRGWSALAGPPPPGGTPSYWLTRHLFLRGLGLVYAVAFSTAWIQGPGLLGSKGLLPMSAFLGRVGARHGTTWEAFVALPTVFWWADSDTALLAVAALGVLGSLAVVAGVTHAGLMVGLWGLYLSIDHVGQRWYAFGWESQLLETGFLAVFLCPLTAWRPFARPPPIVPIWLLRWLVVRIMLGAGLIKLRGDPCWTDLTCLAFHFETQPIPGPLSALFHHAPTPVLRAGVVFNHAVELVAPVFAFGPRRARHLAGLAMVGFQLTLVASGNLSFLNWLTILPCVACFDDGALRRLVPAGLRRRVDGLGAVPVGRHHRLVTYALAGLVGWLSLPVVANLMGSRQAMNRSFDRLHLVNTYGAFGSVGRVRHELVIEGTSDPDPDDPEANWRPYGFRCKPGDPARRPCLITPYHLRLDWLAWFAALEAARSGQLQREDWVLHLLYKLLVAEPVVLDLLGDNPFPNGPPRFVRVSLYRYAFAETGGGNWWTRERLGTLVRPVGAEDPDLLGYLQRRGWVGR